LAYKLGKDFFVGAEYYSDFGKIGDFLPLSQQKHGSPSPILKSARSMWTLASALALHMDSALLIAKIILGYAFPVPGAGEKDNEQLPKTPLR